MNNIAQLAKIRAVAASHLEAVSGWDGSSDKVERKLYQAAKARYVAAERDFQRATCTMSPEEIAALSKAVRG